ncbi:MAG: hypothetical protein AAFV86_20900 [Pseudomonadota bacterium]
MSERTVTAALIAAIALGMAYRLATLVLPAMPLVEFYITEDGYLMLTVARNLAIGNGLSVAGGEIATNGIQPLATFIYALPYVATGGDKTTSIAGVIVIMAAIAGLATWAVWRFAAAVLGPMVPRIGPEARWRPVWPMLAAALFSLGPLLMFHSMNALETGLYTLAVVVTVLFFARLAGTGRAMTLGEQLAFGALCGTVFLCRNDGAVLVVALFAVRFLQVWLVIGRGVAGFRAAVIEALPPGLVSLAIAAPWLVYNYLLFGSIVPISGHAQSITALFGANAALLPVKLFEHMFPMLPVPGGMELEPAVMAVAGIAWGAVFVAGLVLVWRAGGGMRLAVAAYALYALGLAAHYGFNFGAAHFMSRYLAPTAPLMIVLALAVAVALVTRATERFGRRAAQGLPVALSAVSVVLCLGLLARELVPGEHEQGHFQVVRWVEENVGDETWVGAVQTGTLGYWHDRTLNLDGKVNPDALRARMETGSVREYVVASPIQYLADWPGILLWMEDETSPLAQAFEIAVHDERARLVVLARRE